MKPYNKPILVLISTLIVGWNNVGTASASVHPGRLQQNGTANLINDNGSNLKYESPEHLLLGGAIRLSYPNGVIESGSEAQLLTLTLSDGQILNLTFAQLVYLAGDFMGDPKVTIGGNSLEQNMSHFSTNFNAILNPPAKDYLPGIINLVNEQVELNKDNIINGKELNILPGSNIKFNCVTGGGCYEYDWLINYGLYMKLAEVNYDHFGQDAIDSYLAGHRLALLVASVAKLNHNPRLLNKAYAYEGYADHFLSDLFASGHLRTPRKALVNWCKFSPASVSGYLGKIMHDVDNKDGIYMTNNAGVSWKTFGDKEMFINPNSYSMNQAILAMQKSADQIYAVYQGAMSVDTAYDNSKNWLPNLQKTLDDTRNQAPLFKVEAGQVVEYENGGYTLLSNCLVTAIKYGWKNI